MSRTGPPGSPSWSLTPAIVVMVVILAVLTGSVLALRPHGSHRASRAVANPTLRPAAPTAPRPAQAKAPPLGPAPAPTPTARRHRDPFGPAGADLVGSRPGTILAAVYDISSGAEWSLGRGQPQAEASVIKLDILETLLARYRAADPTLPADDLPVAQQMMEFSDNASATALWFAAGGPDEIGSYNAAADLRDTSLSQCVNCPGFPWPGWGLSTTTPQDQITLLRQLISPRSLLTASQRRYALELMENVTAAQRWGVSGGVPPGVTVALKNGWLPLDDTANDWQVNSIGWIRGDGRDYLIAVLTNGSATEQDGIDAITELAGIVWRNMR
jgi:Beta-lactamase enzyme family